MNNESGCSSSSIITRRRVRTYGVPKRCVCGDKVVEFISKSDPNPFRRYYRCVYVATNKLRNDEHTFKWVDEAHLNEIELLGVRIANLEEIQRKLEKEIQMNLEKEIIERMEDALAKSKSEIKKWMISLVIGCVFIVGCIEIYK
ncbi:unnamed protein product [Cochlearia groenlandica]